MLLLWIFHSLDKYSKQPKTTGNLTNITARTTLFPIILHNIKWLITYYYYFIITIIMHTSPFSVSSFSRVSDFSVSQTSTILQLLRNENVVTVLGLCPNKTLNCLFIQTLHTLIIDICIDAIYAHVTYVQVTFLWRNSQFKSFKLIRKIT